jgi:hypothetical protein
MIINSRLLSSDFAILFTVLIFFSSLSLLSIITSYTPLQQEAMAKTMTSSVRPIKTLVVDDLIGDSIFPQHVPVSSHANSVSVAHHKRSSDSSIQGFTPTTPLCKIPIIGNKLCSNPAGSRNEAPSSSTTSPINNAKTPAPMSSPPAPLSPPMLSSKTVQTTSTIRNLTAPSPTSNFLTYDNPIYGIRIQYPPDWNKTESNNNNNNSSSTYTNVVAFLSPYENDSDIYSESLYLIVQNLASQNTPIDEYTNTKINSLKQTFADFRLISSTSTTLADNTQAANQIVFTGNQQQNNLKIMEVYTIIYDKAYTLAYFAEGGKFDSYLPTIQKIINSFEIVTPQGR